MGDQNFIAIFHYSYSSVSPIAIKVTRLAVYSFLKITRGSPLVAVQSYNYKKRPSF